MEQQINVMAEVLIKYQAANRRFAAKYSQDFESFRQSVLGSAPAPDAEQDYFDWELAVTGIGDMTEEIQRLTSEGQRPVTLSG